MGNGSALERYLDHIFLRILNALANCVRDFARFTEAEANRTVAITDDNERRELEDTAALNGFGYAVDGNYALLEFRSRCVNLSQKYSSFV